jgi:two-component system response regulator HydG
MINQKFNVLVVDDFEPVRRWIFHSLERLGVIANFLEVDTASRALAALAEKSFDIIYLDIRLPDMSGIDLLRKIRESNKTSIIIMLTNYSYDQYRMHCRRIGAQAFLDKAVDLDKVGSTLETLIAQPDSFPGFAPASAV